MPKEDKIAYSLYLEMCEKERQKQESLKEQYEKQLEKERKEAEDTIEFSDMRADWFFDAHIQEMRCDAELMKMLKTMANGEEISCIQELMECRNYLGFFRGKCIDRGYPAEFFEKSNADETMMDALKCMLESLAQGYELEKAQKENAIVQRNAILKKLNEKLELDMRDLWDSESLAMCLDRLDALLKALQDSLNTIKYQEEIIKELKALIPIK